MKNSTKAVAIASVLTLLAVAAPAQAVSLVNPEVTTQLADVQTDQAAVGGLVILSAAVAFGINWIKATFF